MRTKYVPGICPACRSRISPGRGSGQKAKDYQPPSQPPTFLIDTRLIATMGLMESNFTFPEPTDIATNGLVDFEY